jgi:hypothetical protein
MAWIIKTVGKNIARNNRLSLVRVQKRTSRYSRLEKAERLNYIVIMLEKRRNIMEGNITIPKKLYLRLQVDSEILNRLKAGGVDNWAWYGESLNPDGESDLDEFEEDFKTRLAAL